MDALKKEEIKKMIARKILPIIGEVDTTTFSNSAEIVEGLILEGAPDITIFICSPGGDVEEGLHVYDLIKTYPGKTTGVVVRHAASMAAIVLQACDIRLGGEHSSILIHNISNRSVSLDIFLDHKRQEKFIAKTLKVQQGLYNIIATRIKKSPEEIKKVCGNNQPMTIIEAQEFGLIDRVITRRDMATFFNPEFLKTLEITEK